jgi:hypothetical protein
MMHPASVDGQALLYDQPLFSNPSYQITSIPGVIKQFATIGVKFVRSLQPGILIMFRSLLWFK